MNETMQALAALLVAGHVTGDFVAQTQWMVSHKDRLSGVAAHVASVVALHLLFLAPFASRELGLVVAALGLAHAGIDVTKSALSRRFPRADLEWFVLDQLAHGVTLYFAWRALAPEAALAAPFAAVDPALLFTLGVGASAYAFNVNGMSSVVAMLLERTELPARAESGPSAGRVIGILERTFALTMILLDRWESVGLLLAAKSLARFKELDERPWAEYYLVGTLLSLLGATLLALGVQFLLK